MCLCVVYAVIERLEAHPRARELLLLLLIRSLIIMINSAVHLKRLADVRRWGLEMLVDLVLSGHGPSDGRANGSELVVLWHSLTCLALHGESRNAWQLPRVFDSVRVESRHVVHPWAKRLMRIRCSNTRPLQPRRIVLLAHHLLTWHIASFLHDIVLLHHVTPLHTIGVLH